MFLIVSRIGRDMKAHTHTHERVVVDRPNSTRLDSTRLPQLLEFTVYSVCLYPKIMMKTLAKTALGRLPIHQINQSIHQSQSVSHHHHHHHYYHYQTPSSNHNKLKNSNEKQEQQDVKWIEIRNNRGWNEEKIWSVHRPSIR